MGALLRTSMLLPSLTPQIRSLTLTVSYTTSQSWQDSRWQPVILGGVEFIISVVPQVCASEASLYTDWCFKSKVESGNWKSTSLLYPSDNLSDVPPCLTALVLIKVSKICFLLAIDTPEVRCVSRSGFSQRNVWNEVEALSFQVTTLFIPWRQTMQPHYQITGCCE